MLIYWVFWGLLGVYLWMVPVWGIGILEVDGGLTVGWGLGVLRPKGARRRAAKKARVPIGAPKKEKKRARKRLSALLRGLARLRAEEIGLRGELGFSDAALTATAWGALTALTEALAVRADASTVQIAPRFDADAPRVRLEGMIRLHIGQIILAALGGEISIAKERISQWTGDRLRASWPPPWKTSAT